MPGASVKSSEPALTIEGEGDRRSLDGVLDLRTLNQARPALQSWRKQRKSHVLDISKLRGLDTPGALFLCELRDRHVELAGVQPEHAARHSA